MLNWPISCLARWQNKTLGNKETHRQWCFFRRGTQTLNSCRSFEYACLYTCWNDLRRPIEKYIFVSGKAPIYMLSRSKAPKYSKFSIANIREHRWIFLWYRMGVDFCSRNNFKDFCSFAKDSVLLESMMPWCYQGIIDMNRNGNFCKGTWIFKIVARAQVDARAAL